MSFGTNLQYIRKCRGLTQEQLAEQMSVSRQSVSKWESDATLPELEKLIALCELQGCTLDNLLRGDLAALEAEDTAHYDDHYNHFSKQIRSGVQLILWGIAAMSLCEWARQFWRTEQATSAAGANGPAEITFTPAFPEEVGTIVFFLFLIAAISLLILGGLEHSRFVAKHPCITPFYTEAQLDAHHTRFTRQIVFGVAACLFSIVLLLAGDAFATAFTTGWLVLAVFLFVLSIGVGQLVFAGIQHSKYDIESYNRANALSPAEKAREERVERICGCIMLLATAAFLFSGFVYGLWHINWVAFAVGGLLCAAVSVALGRAEH